MKKCMVLFLAACLMFAATSVANAIDFKAKGQWIMSFDYGENGNFMGKYDGHTQSGSHYGSSQGYDDFEARQRLRLQLDAVASESLSGTVYFEIGEDFWGRGGNAPKGGAALGADSTGIIKLKNAYLDWSVPDADFKVRMGIQSFTLPSYTTSGSFVLYDDMAGIITSYTANENVALTALWARPFNDNYQSDRGDRDGYLDNLDVIGLLVPMKFDGFRLTPWGLYAGIGPNTFRGHRTDEFGVSTSDILSSSWTATTKVNGLGGLFPIGGARHKNFSSANNVASRKLNSYGNAWWGGFTGEITRFEPFRFAWDFTYGSVSWEDDGRLNRQGWMGSLLFEYKLDWAVPGLYGWYSSGDDSNPANGSERLPLISGGNSVNQFSTYAFNGDQYISRDSVISGPNSSMVGTWGVGARLKDISFIEDLKHTVRVNMIGGTNSKSMAKKMSQQGYWANGTALDHQYISYNANGLYMTTGDTALDIGIRNVYKMYENFNIVLDAGYIALWLDTGTSAWGARHKEGKSIPQTKDAWNINMAFVYQF